MSVWIRHVQSDRQQTTEYYENLGRQRSAGAAPPSVDQQLEIDGAPLDLAEIELVVIDLPLNRDGLPSARIYYDRASVQPDRVLQGPAARELRQALADRTLPPEP